jgi:hypothetical protein
MMRRRLKSSCRGVQIGARMLFRLDEQIDLGGIGFTPPKLVRATVGSVAEVRTPKAPAGDRAT